MITAPWGQRLGGAESFLWTFLRYVDRRQIQPIVVFLQAGPFEREVATLGIQTMVIPAGRLRNPRAAVKVIRLLIELLNELQPQLIVNWSAKTHLYGASAAIVAGMADRVVWWQHGITSRNWMDRLATVLPARVVGSCSVVAKRAQEAVWPHRRTVVVYPGIEKPRPTPAQELAALRRDLAIPPGRLVIGTVGRLERGKGQHLFLAAMSALRAKGYDVHGLVVGGDAYDLSPDYKRYLHHLRRELGLEASVVFTGQVPSATPYMRLMDIYVSPSLGESFGMVIVEAMALGLPIVSFASGGPAEIIDDSRSGLLIPLGDGSALVRNIERLVADSALRNGLARTAHQRFETAFSAERMTREMEALFQDLCVN